MGDIFAIIVPIVIVVVVLKVCLICCRIWLYQKRREQQYQCIQQRQRMQSGRATARVIAVRQVQGPCGIAHQTAYSIDQPGLPTRQVTRTVIVRPASRRPNDPNLPPSYDQAVTGADRSISIGQGNKKQPGKNPPQQPLPQSHGASDPPPPPPPSLPLPHMPPQRSSNTLPPAYEPTPSAPPPDFSPSDRQRLL